MASVAKRTWTHEGETKTAWVCRYTDGAGKRRMKTFEQKKAADRFRLSVENELAAGVHTPAKATKTVAAVCDAFMRDAEDRRNDGRIGRGRYNVLDYATKRFAKHLGPRPFSELVPAELNELYRRMVRLDGMAPASAKDWLKIFGAVESFAVREGYTKKRLVSDVVRELRGVKRKRPRTFTVEQVFQLLDAARVKKDGGQERSHCLLNCYVYLAALAGLRFGEIQGLTLDTIDLDARVIRVRHNLTAFDEHKGPKTESGVRDFPMPGPVHALLTVWLQRFYVENPRRLVFGSKGGKPIAQPNFRVTYWLPLLKAAGLEDAADPLHFHALRAFAASWMFQSGFGINEVPGLLGHKHFDTTLQHYTHSVRDGTHHREAVDRMVGSLFALPHPANFATRAQHDS